MLKNFFFNLVFLIDFQQIECTVGTQGEFFFGQQVKRTIISICTNLFLYVLFHKLNALSLSFDCEISKTNLSEMQYKQIRYRLTQFCLNALRSGVTDKLIKMRGQHLKKILFKSFIIEVKAKKIMDIRTVTRIIHT